MEKQPHALPAWQLQGGHAQIPLDERRQAARTSVFLPATIFLVDRVIETRIHNASSSGLMGESDAELSLGQTVHLAFGSLSLHPGVIQRVEGRRYGLKLANALQIAAGTRLSETEDGPYAARAVRVPLDVLAHLHLSRPPRPATVRNMSAKGLLLDSGPEVCTGQRVIVAIKGKEAVRGRVQWSSEGRAGIRLDCTTAAPFAPPLTIDIPD